MGATEILVHTISLWYFSQQSRHRTRLEVHQQRDAYVWDTHTVEFYLGVKKRDAVCKEMDETRDHAVK